MDNGWVAPGGELAEPEPLADWVLGLDQRLSGAGTALSERAFSLGCTTSLAPMVIVLVVAFLLGVRHWISLFLLGLALLLLGGAWAAFVANQASRKAMQRLWIESLQAEVQRGLEERGIDREDFTAQLAGLLPQHAPLRQCVNKMEPLPASNTENA